MRGVTALAGALLGLILLPVLLMTMFTGGAQPQAAASGCKQPASASAPTTAEAVDVRSVAGFSADQLHNAGTIIAVAQKMGLSQRGQIIGVMVAMGESDLTNIDVGDAAGPDSRGLFQQRDNGAWGTYAERMDPAHAAGAFYRSLQGLAGWEGMSATAAAHAVQRNADPNFYTRYFARAEQIVAGAGGAAVAAVQPVAAVPCPAPGAATGQVGQASSAAAQTAIAFAMSKRGLPYLWGGTGPLYDCSGLTQAAYAAAGVSLPRDTYGQVKVGVPVNQAQIAPGDLWFPDPGHVELVISATEAVEAPYTGQVIRVSPINRPGGVFRRVV